MKNKIALKKFGARIREIRIKKGWSQELTAKKAGIDRGYFGGIERGEKNITLKKVAVIAKTLGVKMSDLFKLVPVKRKNKKRNCHA